MVVGERGKTYFRLRCFPVHFEQAKTKQKVDNFFFEFTGLYKKRRDDYNFQGANDSAESYPGSHVWLSSKRLLECVVCLHSVKMNISDLRVER